MALAALLALTVTCAGSSVALADEMPMVPNACTVVVVAVIGPLYDCCGDPSAMAVSWPEPVAEKVCAGKPAAARHAASAAAKA